MTFTYQSLALSTGVRLAYVDDGQGEPLLLLHGFTGTALGHLDTIMLALQGRYRLIAPDLRGYGASQPPTRDYPPDFYQRDAADVAALLTALNCGPATVLGFSDGAESALLLAAGWPHLVQRVFAWGVSGVMSAEMVASVQEWLPISAWGPEGIAWRESIIVCHGLHQLVPMVTGWVRAAEAIHQAGGNVCLAEAAQIQCPVWLVNGTGEVGNTQTDTEQLATRIPDSQLHFVPNCGHAIHREQFDIFMGLVERFLGGRDK